MDYKKKLKSRLYVAIIYIALGVMMIVGVFEKKTDKDFLSSLGIILVIMGIVRIRNYFLITRNEETIRKQQVIETDERNISILHNAKSAAFSIFISLSATASIIFSLFNMRDIAKWFAYSVFLLVIIYWICYWVYRKKT